MTSDFFTLASLSQPDATFRDAVLARLEGERGMRRTVLGHSILGRIVDCLTWGNGPRHLLYVGGHHAAEWLGISLLFAFAERLSRPVGKMGKNATVYGVNCDLLQQLFTFWIIPSANPDGLELRLHGPGNTPLSARQRRMGGEDFSGWQANARGVDLNHNFDYRFSAYRRLCEEREILPGPTLFPGEYPESEPETRILAGFLQAVAPAALLTLHSQGEVIYHAPATPYARRVALRLGRTLGYRVETPKDTAAFSGLSDYAGYVLGIPSFTVEVGWGRNPLPPAALPAALERALPALFRFPLFLA